MNNYVPAIITPLDNHMGLDIARSLGRRGIPVYGLDPDSSVPGRWSKYCRFIHCPSPKVHGGADTIQHLVDFGKKLGCKAVLYALSDEYVLLCSRERDQLLPYFEFVMPDHQTIMDLATKDGLTRIAETCGIPAPKTIFLNPQQTVEWAAKQLTFPVILKPTESTYWHNPNISLMLRGSFLAGRAKVILCQTPQDLFEAYQRIAAIDPRLVVQEVIPGEDSRLDYISFYLDRQSKSLAVFAGRKHRVIPIGFGSASYVRSLMDDDLKTAAFKLLEAVSYKGLGGIEFKKDPRDDTYKLVEFNTRFGMWDGLGAKCGVDLAHIAYCDALGLPVEPIFTYRENIIWCDWERDLRAAMEYKKGGKLTYAQWLRSLKGEKMWAIYSWDDWLPGAVFTLELVKTFFNRLAGR